VSAKLEYQIIPYRTMIVATLRIDVQLAGYRRTAAPERISPASIVIQRLLDVALNADWPSRVGSATERL
jgi:hypothetical protein